MVFVGPYEHHSNEVSWRECFAEVVEIDLNGDGLLDMDDLRAKVADKRYDGRRKIGAFSAASNVSGVTTPVYEVARILHENGALAFFDFAAAAPYVEIDMNRDAVSFFDALYFSPHKFLGGPGSSGVLIFHQDIYRADLPPTVGAGGTVDFVGFESQSYSTDIETREKPARRHPPDTARGAGHGAEGDARSRADRRAGSGAHAPRLQRAVRVSGHRADGGRRAGTACPSSPSTSAWARRGSIPASSPPS